jgi:DHA3 family macrolide efflux protein-like MFS transporter
LLIISLMTVGINLTIIPAFSLLPLMVKDYFNGNAIQLGWVESAMGIGVFAGGALLGAWGGFQRKILTSMLGLMGMGAGTLILALAPASVLSLAVGGAFLVGLANPLTMGPFMAVIQSTVEPDMQARILSLIWSIGSGMVPLGLMVAGPVADRVSIQAWFYLGGALCIFMSLVGLCIPAVMNIEFKGQIAIKNRQAALQESI